jgi:probable F420-dependent oxidoreductase
MTALGRFGAWMVRRDWPADPGHVGALAAELESLGFAATWVGDARGDLVLPARILAGSTTLQVATGIVNIWRFPADQVAASYRRLVRAHPDRLVLGIGVGHAPLIAGYERPMAKLAAYLDELDSAAEPVLPLERIVAALGPSALRLAAARSLGTHPYLVPPEHTARAREALGPGPLLAPEQMVLFEADPSEARACARRTLAPYLELPNYLTSLRRLALDDHDFAGGGSDRLVDRLVAWGGDDDIRGRIEDHLAAGADHVAVQVLRSDPSAPPSTVDWTRLAELLPR